MLLDSWLLFPKNPQSAQLAKPLIGKGKHNDWTFLVFLGPYLGLGAAWQGREAVRADTLEGHPGIVFVPRGRRLQRVDSDGVDDKQPDGRLWQNMTKQSKISQRNFQQTVAKQQRTQVQHN